MRSADTAFWELATFHGIVPSYVDVEGHVHEASRETVTLVLQSLGVPLEDPEDAAALLRDQQADVLRRCLEPVLVHRVGRHNNLLATVPDTWNLDDLWLTIEFEQGHTAHLRLRDACAGVTGGSEAEGVRYQHLRLDLSLPTDKSVPPGRHQLVLEGVGTARGALLLSAPDCPVARRQTGAFVPLYGLRTIADWGIGSYSDLSRFSAWASGEGCSLVGTLPLYPAFLEPPADPSPYLPVSRLAYNEVFIDPVVLPEFADSSDVRQFCGSAWFRDHVASLRAADLVAYEEVAKLKRIVLEQLAQRVTSGEMPRRQRELEEFIRLRPELEGYARFRARLDSPDGRECPSALAYHRYCQWTACEQLVAASGHAGRYADLPIGSHPAGFDPDWYPDSFVRGLHGGAPPDQFFPLGQDWGFQPLHPQRTREDGYAFLSAALRRAFLHADCLRIDHVMGLQRLFMIPEGYPDGVYVSYRAEELHALVALEASRAGSVVVGEDLGTVPDEVRPRMARDGILRTWVFQFESTEERPLPTPPGQSLASMGTHDLPRFGTYLWGDDITARETDGLLSAVDALSERQARERWRESLFDALHLSDIDADSETLTKAALEGCLRFLAQSESPIVLVDMPELWGERGQENVPGSTGSSWRRRSSLTLDQIEEDRSTNDVLRQMAVERQG